MADNLALVSSTELSNPRTVAEAFYNVEREIAERVEQVQNNEWMLGVLLLSVEAHWDNITKQVKPGVVFDAWASSCTRRQKRTWRNWMNNAEAFFVSELGRRITDAAGGPEMLIANVPMDKATALRPFIESGMVSDKAIAALADPSITAAGLLALSWEEPTPTTAPVNGGHLEVNIDLREIQLHWDDGIVETLFTLGSPESSRGKSIQRQVLAFLGVGQRTCGGNEDR